MSAYAHGPQGVPLKVLSIPFRRITPEIDYPWGKVREEGSG